MNTRGLECGPAVDQASKFKYSRRDAQAGWVASSLQEFLASDDPDSLTTVFIHGNRISDCMARDWVGSTAYRELVRQAPDERPLRFVIWSWPSERIDGGLLEDVRVKAFRTDREGYYLARFLDQLDPRLQISLIGYSFGARIADGALHLLGGGKICQYNLSAPVHPQRLGLRTVLLAAGEDNDWLLPGRRFDKALPQCEQLINIYNSCDRALERYHLLYGRRCCQEALGYTGLVGLNLLGPDSRKIAQFDACCIVGREHNWMLYFESPSLIARMVPYVFFQGAKAETGKVAFSAANPAGSR